MNGTLRPERTRPPNLRLNVQTPAPGLPGLFVQAIIGFMPTANVLRPAWENKCSSGLAILFTASLGMMLSREPARGTQPTPPPQYPALPSGTPAMEV